MQQVGRFLSRSLISLWAVLITASLSLLLFNAPNVPHYTPFEGINILAKDNSAVYLPNRIFDCAETSQQFHCQAIIQDRLLDLLFTKGDYQYDLSNCRAQFDGQSVSCEETGINYAPILSERYTLTEIELNAQQIRDIRKQYWGINALMALSEPGLLLIGMQLSALTGISAAFFTWFHPGLSSRIFSALALGFAVSYFVVWNVVGGMVPAHGFTPEAWEFVVNGVVIASGVGTAIFILLWLRPLANQVNLNRAARTFLCVGNGLGGVVLFSWLSLYILLSLGYAD